jgi:hypothetical protein
MWEDGLQLLTSLKQLRLRSWRSLRGMPGSVDGFIRKWLIKSPPSLCDVKICTKAHTSGTDERLIAWSRCPEVGSWQKTYEQEGRVDDSDFL